MTDALCIVAAILFLFTVLGHLGGLGVAVMLGVGIFFIVFS